MQSSIYHVVNKSKASLYYPGCEFTWGNLDGRNIDWPVDPTTQEYFPSYTVDAPPTLFPSDRYPTTPCI
jgi:hypothetical protein